jgi:hypothetical protein
LSIEIEIFHIFTLSEALSEALLGKYGSQEVAWIKLKKGPLRDYKTAFFDSGYNGSGGVNY